MKTLFYKALTLQGEIWCWSLSGLKGLTSPCWASTVCLLSNSLQSEQVDQPRPQANSRYPSERKRLGTKRDSRWWRRIRIRRGWLRTRLKVDRPQVTFTCRSVTLFPTSHELSLFLDAPPTNVSVVNVTTSCVRIKWDPFPVEQLGGAIRGYQVSYAVVGESNATHMTCNVTSEVEICNLPSYTTYKYSVRRYSRNKLGNSSEVQYFTTLEQGKIHFAGFPLKW